MMISTLALLQFTSQISSNLHHCIAMPVNHCFLQLKEQIAKKDKQLYSSLTGTEPAGEGPFRSREKDEKLPAPLIRYGQSDPYGLTFPPTMDSQCDTKRRRQDTRAFEQDPAGSPVAPTCKHLAGPSPAEHGTRTTLLQVDAKTVLSH